MLRRFVGILLLFVALGTFILCGVALRAGRQAIDRGATQTSTALNSAEIGLTTARDTLLLTRSTIVEVNASLGTVETAARNASVAISDTQPVLNEVETLTSETVPESLETFQEALPELVAVAGAIDDTLVTLAAFQIDQEIAFPPLSLGPLGEVELPSYNLDFGLGIEYEPERPFDESVADLGASLEGVPGQLRTAGANLEIAAENLNNITTDLNSVANDLGRIETQVAQVPSLLDDYLDIVDDLEEEVRNARTQVDDQAATLKMILTVGLIWLALTQVASLYLGYELLAGNRPVSPERLPDETPSAATALENEAGAVADDSAHTPEGNDDT